MIAGPTSPRRAASPSTASIVADRRRSALPAPGCSGGDPRRQPVGAFRCGADVDAFQRPSGAVRESARDPDSGRHRCRYAVHDEQAPTSARAAASTRSARRRRRAWSASAPHGATLGALFRLWGQTLGPRRLLSFRSRSRRPRVRGRARVARRSAADPADTARPDRARDPRLRPAASLLPLPKERAMSKTAGARRWRRSPWRPAGCGGSSKPSFPTVGAARTYKLTQFDPSSPAHVGEPVTVSFAIRQPDGTPLTTFKRGPGPHTGVHLILVRRDLARSSTATRRSTRRRRLGQGRVRACRPVPRRRRRLPGRAGPAAELPALRHAACRGRLPPAAAAGVHDSATVDGYRFTLHGTPRLRRSRRATSCHRHRPAGPPGDLHAVVRRARARDLLPQGLARLLPHAHLRAGCERLHEHARRRRR